jgi:hypothetical protein
MENIKEREIRQFKKRKRKSNSEKKKKNKSGEQKWSSFY